MTTAFWVMTILCCSYAAWFGRSDGRCASLLILAAVVLTTIAQILDADWTATHWPVTIVDVLLWVALIHLMLRSRSYWPMWMAAAQTLTVATHAATSLISHFNQEAYVGLGTVWSIPCLLSMAFGVSLDSRRNNAGL